MKGIRRLIKYGFYGTLLLAILLSIVAIYLFSRSHTQRSGVLQLSGLEGQVIIERDKHGVPHITAKSSDLDAFYALGFVHAQDRFWQMEMQRHIASGRLSEIFGKGALPKDIYLRTWGFYRAAKADWQGLSDQTKAIAEHYTQGVNAFLARGHLPLQFTFLRHQPQPWSVVDTIVWQKMMAWDLQTIWQGKLINYVISKQLSPKQIPVLQPPYPAGAPTVLGAATFTKLQSIDVNEQPLLPGETVLASEQSMREQLGFHDVPGKGSNNWVVAGKHTESGKPLLANDPHLGIKAPLLWYLAELEGPTLHVQGASIPGLPMVVIGHNEHIAWGVTNVNPDTQDLYVESDETALKTIDEEIKIKGGESYHLKVKLSEHGPIMSGVIPELKVLGENVALKWTALMPGDTTANSFIELNYANNWLEFVDAMKDFVTPSQNFIYADTDGNIGYYMPGKIPLRKGWNGSLPVMPGEKKQWDGYIDFEDLPQLYNPPSGIIATANNKVADASYPYMINFRWKTAPYRIEQILSRLKDKKSLTSCDMAHIQLDAKTRLWGDLKPYLLNTKAKDEASRQGLDLLREWQGEMRIDSSAATVFSYWLRELNRLMPQAVRNINDSIEPIFLMGQFKGQGEYCKRLGFDDCAAFLSDSLSKAMAQLIDKRGQNSNHWAWGQTHQAVFEELGIGKSPLLGWLWNRQIASPGSDFTVNAGTYDQDFTQIEGAGYRQVIDLADLKDSLYIQALGQVDAPWSSHQDDLMHPWRDGKLLKMQPEGERSQLVLLPLENRR